jgi:hypothetical protein
VGSSPAERARTFVLLVPLPGWGVNVAVYSEGRTLECLRSRLGHGEFIVALAAKRLAGRPPARPT